MNNKVYAIIPARLGSKRLKDKNVVLLKGKPLIMWTIDEALNSKYIDNNNLYVSTESEKIKKLVSQKCRIINRPQRLSEDNIWTQDVINHAVLNLKIINKEDIIVILQANSPQIEAKMIDRCIEKLINEDLWEVHTVSDDYINNGAIHVLRARVCSHVGKVNYNGVIITNYIDIHTQEDLNKASDMMIVKNA